MCTADNCHFTFTAVTSASGLSRAHQLIDVFGATTFRASWELVGLPRGVPRSQPLGTRRFQKQKLLGIQSSNFFSSCPWYGRARQEVTIQMHQDKVIMQCCSSRADPGGSSSKKLNLASLSRPSAFTSTS